MALKFDKSQPGFALSTMAHTALIAAGVFAFAFQRYPEAQEGIPVEVFSDAQFSEITKGEKTAEKVQPQPKPRADRVAEKVEEREPGEAQTDAPSPPQRPAEMKVDDKPVEAAAAPPPPLRPALESPPAPSRQVEAKPEPAPKAPEPPKRQDVAKLAERADAEAELRAKAEAEAKARSERDAKVRAEAEARAQAKAEAEAKAIAEADAKAKAEAEAERRKVLAEAKAKADTKAKAEAEAKAKRQAELADKFNADDIAKLLQSREPSQSSGSTGREVQRTASLGSATGNAEKLNMSQRQALMGIIEGQLRRCWEAPLAAQSASNPPIPTVKLKLNQDGSLAAEPAVLNNSGDTLFRATADSAMRATRRCAPLKIPAQFAPYYQDWKDLVVNFDPRET